MANAAVFGSSRGRMLPKANTKNHAGGVAFTLDDQAALAQLAVTGSFNETYYVSPEEQIETLIGLAEKVEPDYLAKTAIYARERGYMKDAPAVLLAVLSRRDPALFRSAFARVIDSPKMLRTFVQVMRSGAAGRKSLGTAPKRMVQKWFASRTSAQIFRGSIGTNPSIPDVLKMVHPRTEDPEMNALFAYLIGREYNATHLPAIVQQFESFKKATTDRTVPNVPFQMLSALKLTTDEWKALARTMNWTTLRMNLNTLKRNGVFDDKEMVAFAASRLADADEIRRAKVFPYQLLTAYLNVSADMPRPITNALQDAMEVAIENVPAIDGQVFVFPDVSGSMSSPATGYRRGATSAARCIDIAALVAAAVMRKNPDARVIPFEGRVINHLDLNSRDSVMTNAKKLASIGGGSTDCSAPLARLNEEKATGDLVIYVSDNESWLDSRSYGYGPTETMREWTAFKRRNPKAKLVCIDITPNTSTQAKEREDILNIGGFSDTVFSIVKDFAAGTLNGKHLVGTIEAITI